MCLPLDISSSEKKPMPHIIKGKDKKINDFKNMESNKSVLINNDMICNKPAVSIILIIFAYSIFIK